MRLFRLLSICLFVFSFTNAQELDISSFKKNKKVKIKAFDHQKQSLDQVRSKQKGFMISFLASPSPKGLEIKLHYTDESLIGFGFYLGIGRTYTFTSTYENEDGTYIAPRYFDLSAEDLEDFDDWINEDLQYKDHKDYYYDTNTPHPYVSLGVSKNIKLRHTLYTGYSRILGVERDEGSGLNDGSTSGYEEMHIIDFGYIFKTRSIALTIGIPLHLPRYKFPDEEYSGASFRPQIGIGYIL